jgi:serine protease Do
MGSRVGAANGNVSKNAYAGPGNPADDAAKQTALVAKTSTDDTGSRGVYGETDAKAGNGGMAGRFLRAVCLVLACTIFSAAATYGVFEYRLTNGDFPPIINQVVLGNGNEGGDGDNAPQQDAATPSPAPPSDGQQGGVSAPIYTPSNRMSGEDIYEIACQQVVGIRTLSSSDPGGFFGGGAVTTSSGSGFIISSSGYILTNYHVIEDAYRSSLPLKVSLHDETEFDAKVIGFEASNDIAVIKIEATGLNAVAFADSDKIRVGQEVYAVGNPLGELPYTMTDGIVSALNRIVTVDNKVINTFQLTAAVNSGNSGGPVYNTNGEVIGVVSAKIMGGSVEGIGFAIPINDAESIAVELIEHGYLTGRPLIGITVQTVTSGHAEYYGWVEGVYIKTVSFGSAADKAGLRVGDIITKLGDSV